MKDHEVVNALVTIELTKVRSSYSEASKIHEPSNQTHLNLDPHNCTQIKIVRYIVLILYVTVI